jgi:type I restriction enzyme S subunit
MAAGRFKTVEFPVPPLDEQRHIVDETERRLSFLDAVASEARNALRRSAALRRAVLETAFTGKLVPQDPSDEPASALVERIVAERAAHPSPRRRKVGA